MRLTIVHQNQENHVGNDREMKKEEEMEHTRVRIRPEEESMKENSSPLNPSPISVSDPVLASGKRKREPKEINDEISPILRRRKKPSTSKSKDAKRDSAGTLMSNGDATNDRSSSAVTPFQVKSPTMIRAEEVQSSLGNEHPIFLKTLVRSHVASCFWMGLPFPFCKLFLPTKDTTVTIEDENGEEFGVKYIANKTGLSAGWRKFVSGNKLLEGDVLIFQLVRPCRFKNFEHHSADGDTELASMNSGIPTIKIKRQNYNLNNFSSSMKCSKDHVRLLLLALMMMGTLVAASRYAADHDQPQERQDSVVTLLFILCDSTMFVTSLAGVIYLLHEFPFKPWPQITVSMLFGPYMLLAFEISTNEALPLRALSIPILLALPLLAISIPILLLAAVGKLSDFVWERSFSGSGDTCPT